MANSSLNTYSHGLKDDDLLSLKGEIVELLRKKGLDASAVDGAFDLRATLRAIAADANGSSLQGASTIAQDIDERVRAAEALRLSEESSGM